MGRHAGWLTAASTLGKSTEEDGPHLVYVPEKVFNLDEFLKDVKEVYDSLGRCVVAVSEGIHNKDGEYFLQRGSQIQLFQRPQKWKHLVSLKLKSQT